MSELTACERESAAIDPYREMITKKFPNEEWLCLRWLFLIAGRLVIKSQKPASTVHALTYRDYTALSPALDDRRVAEIVAAMVIILAPDAKSSVTIVHKGSQVTIGLNPA